MTIPDMMVPWFLLLVMGCFDQLQSTNGWLKYKIVVAFWSSSEMLIFDQLGFQIACLDFSQFLSLHDPIPGKGLKKFSLLITSYLQFDFEEKQKSMIKKKNCLLGTLQIKCIQNSQILRKTGSLSCQCYVLCDCCN